MEHKDYAFQPYFACPLDSGLTVIFHREKEVPEQHSVLHTPSGNRIDVQSSTSKDNAHQESRVSDGFGNQTFFFIFETQKDGKGSIVHSLQPKRDFFRNVGEFPTQPADHAYLVAVAVVIAEDLDAAIIFAEKIGRVDLVERLQADMDNILFLKNLVESPPPSLLTPV